MNDETAALAKEGLREIKLHVEELPARLQSGEETAAEVVGTLAAHVYILADLLEALLDERG